MNIELSPPVKIPNHDDRWLVWMTWREASQLERADNLTEMRKWCWDNIEPVAMIDYNIARFTEEHDALMFYMRFK